MHALHVFRFSDEASDLLAKIFVVNPDKRIKIEDICGEPWYKIVRVMVMLMRRGVVQNS